MDREQGMTMLNRRQFFGGAAAAALLAQRTYAAIEANGGYNAARYRTVVPEYNDPLRYTHLADDLSRRGWPASRIDKVLGANFARLFAEVWDARSW